MKLDTETRERLMTNHKERLEAQANATLDVPLIRASVSQHSKKNKGFVKRTENRTLARA